MTDPLTVAALKTAEIVAPELVKAGSRRLGWEILGTPAERGMQDVYTHAIAGLLAEIGEVEDDSIEPPDPEAMKVANTMLRDLCSDAEAAGMLLDVALRPGPVPVEDLWERATALGYEPSTLPFVFDGAMRRLVDNVWQEFLKEAGEPDSSIRGLATAEALSTLREHHQALQATSIAYSGSNLTPPPPGLILGRTDELREIKQALGVGYPREAETGHEVEARSSRVATIHGWPGGGKSTFAAALCRDAEVLEHFAGGVHFLPVGRSPEVHRLAEELCAALGAPAPPGTKLDALRGRIAKALSQNPVLVVFDDVWEESHVAPLLLAGGDSAMLVATRRLDVATRVSSSSKNTWRLGLLSEQDSLELIKSRAPGAVADNEEACRELVRALDGLPLALRVAADLLQVESEVGFDVTELLGELTEAGRVLDEEAPYDTVYDDQAQEAVATVRALLQRSMERLDGETVKRFARLGVLPSKPLSFDPWAAQDVWRDTAEDIDPKPEDQELEHNRVRREIGELVRRGLVESAAGGLDPLAVKLDLRSKSPERFWMHALVAAFAFETLENMEGNEGVREAQQRRLEHYRRVVGAADETLRMGRDSLYFGAYLVTLDLPSIRAVHQWARERATGDRWALEYLSRLPAQSHRVFSERLTPGEFLDWLTLAEGAARTIGDDHEARSHRETVGAALLMKGHHQEALAYCEESVEAAKERDDKVAEATGLANCASIRNSMGEHKAALGLARRSERLLRHDEALDTRLGAIGQQAVAFKGLGRPAKAEKRYKARLDLAWDGGELSYYARTLRDLAQIKRERPEERDEARGMYDEAAREFWELREYDNYRSALNGKGALEIDCGSLEAAEDLFRRSLDSADDEEHAGDQARARMNLGIVYQNRETWQSYEAAEAKYREALPLAADWDEPELLGDVLFNLAQLLFYLMSRHQDARVEAVSSAEAYGRAASPKETRAQDLINEIDKTLGRERDSTAGS